VFSSGCDHFVASSRPRDAVFELSEQLNGGRRHGLSPGLAGRNCPVPGESTSQRSCPDSRVRATRRARASRAQGLDSENDVVT
jgi:hypothetical protein